MDFIIILLFYLGIWVQAKKMIKNTKFFFKFLAIDLSTNFNDSIFGEFLTSSFPFIFKINYHEFKLIRGIGFRFSIYQVFGSEQLAKVNLIFKKKFSLWAQIYVLIEKKLKCNDFFIFKIFIYTTKIKNIFFFLGDSKSNET